VLSKSHRDLLSVRPIGRRRPRSSEREAQRRQIVGGRTGQRNRVLGTWQDVRKTSDTPRWGKE
jgi:hypothetical protein